MVNYDYGPDIYTEKEVDENTLSVDNLGPLYWMAGKFEGEFGVDVSPKAEGPEEKKYKEYYNLQPTDPQHNGPQCYYGLRYHTQIFADGEEETFHDQVGHWLYEPETGNIMLTMSIPRGLTLIATGNAPKDAKTFKLTAARGGKSNGIISNPFLEEKFKVIKYEIEVEIHKDGWSYHQETTMLIPNYDKAFVHSDAATLRRIARPGLNPLARIAQEEEGFNPKAPDIADNVENTSNYMNLK